MSGQDSGALVKQITQLFRDKEEVDAQLEKEKKARARSDQALEDAEQERLKAVALKNDAENQLRKLEESQGILEDQLSEERQKRFQAEKNVERLLSGLKEELLDPEEAERCNGDLRSQLGELQDAARRLRREMQTEKSDKGSLQDAINQQKVEIAKGEQERADLETEMDDMRGRLKKMGELRSQIDAAKDQARKEVEEARRRGRDQLEEERAGRLRAETMYQDALKDATKYDQDRRTAEMAAESLQRDLDSERQKSMRLEEDKAHLENGRKEHDRIKAQAEATMENTHRELDEMKDDCGRLRTMLEEEKKQRNIAEEAWKEYSKRLHAERLAYEGPTGKFPNDEEIMDAVYGNLNGLERDSSDEEELSQQSYRPRQLPSRPQTSNQPSVHHARRGRPKAKQNAQRREIEAPRKLQPVVVPPHSPVPQPQMNSFPSSGFVQVPRSMRNSPSGPTQFPESMMNQEEAVGFGHPPTGVQVYPTVQEPHEVRFPRDIEGNRWGWVRNLNPLRIRSNPFAWLWTRRGEMVSGVGHGVTSSVETVGRAGTKLAQSFWTWVIVLALLAGTASFRDDEDEKRPRTPRTPRAPRTPRYPPSQKPTGETEIKAQYKAGSFAG